MDKIKVPLKWETKAERRHYERRAKRLERFLIKLFKQLEG